MISRETSPAVACTAGRLIGCGSLSAYTFFVLFQPEYAAEFR
jgi:hypothetical protein